MQLPAMDPAMPARFGPVCLRVDRGVGDLARVPMLLVPDPAPGLQDRAVDRRRTPAIGPRLQTIYQIRPEARDPRRRRAGQGVQPALPGPSRWEPTVDGQPLPQRL